MRRFTESAIFAQGQASGKRHSPFKIFSGALDSPRRVSHVWPTPTVNPTQPSLLSRRQALATAAAALTLPFTAVPRALAADAAPAPSHPGRPKIGLAGYSLRKYALDDAVAVVKKLGITHVAVFRVHVPILIGTPEQCAAGAKPFHDAGLDVYSTGVTALGSTEASMRRAFECAKAAGLKKMAANYAEPPTPEVLKLTERFIKEYDISITFHNHGPEDRIFPSPYDALRAVEPYDPRMGLCLDVGHCRRYGIDPVEAIHRCRPRLLDVHMKDSVAPVGAKKDIPADMGFGYLDLRAIATALVETGYDGSIGLEYEVDSPDPTPNMAQSFGYLRGLFDALLPKATA